MLSECAVWLDQMAWFKGLLSGAGGGVAQQWSTCLAKALVQPCFQEIKHKDLMSRLEYICFNEGKRNARKVLVLVTSEMSTTSLCSGFEAFALSNGRQVQCAPFLKESCCWETAVLPWSYSLDALRGWLQDHLLFIGSLGIMWLVNRWARWNLDFAGLIP